MEIIIKIIIAVVVVILYALLLALPVMWIWNYLMPDLFGLKEIGFWQALCLNLLCGFLFKDSSSSSKDKD